MSSTREKAGYSVRSGVFGRLFGKMRWWTSLSPSYREGKTGSPGRSSRACAGGNEKSGFALRATPGLACFSSMAENEAWCRSRDSWRPSGVVTHPQSASGR